jgi:hypothetical protein
MLRYRNGFWLHDSLSAEMRNPTLLRRIVAEIWAISRNAAIGLALFVCPLLFLASPFVLYLAWGLGYIDDHSKNWINRHPMVGFEHHVSTGDPRAAQHSRNNAARRTCQGAGQLIATRRRKSKYP